MRVNAICPGLIETGMTEFIYRTARERGAEARLGQLNPLQRGGEPAEIARAALYLASDEASYVNGHALVVDGGLSRLAPVHQTGLRPHRLLIASRRVGVTSNNRGFADNMASGSFRFETFALDPDDRQLKRDDAPVELNARYFDALTLLVRENGKLVSKDRFLEEVWRGVPVTDEALTQCIKTLRRQLSDDAASPRFIETVPQARLPLHRGRRMGRRGACGSRPHPGSIESVPSALPRLATILPPRRR